VDSLNRLILGILGPRRAPTMGRAASLVAARLLLPLLALAAGLLLADDASAIERVFRGPIDGAGSISRSFPETTCVWRVRFTGDAVLTLVESSGNVAAGSTIRLQGSSTYTVVSGTTPSFTCLGGGDGFDHTYPLTGTLSSIAASGVFDGIFHLRFAGHVVGAAVSGTVTAVYDIPAGANGSVVSFALTLAEAGQIPPIFTSVVKQGAGWGDYDDGGTIAAYGCALTSLVMTIKELTGTSDSTLNPRTLNEWLNTHRGYTTKKPSATGWINWKALEQYAPGLTLTSILRPSAVSRAEVDRVIEAELALGNPVIAKVPGNSNPQKNHFVVITGIGTSSDGHRTYLIADPGPEKTNLHEGYHDVIRQIYVFHYISPDDAASHEPLAATDRAFLNISATGGVELLVFDPQNRRTGVDPGSRAELSEIPDAAYDLNSIDSLDPAFPPTPSTAVFESLAPEEGSYRVRVHSRTATAYAVTLLGYDRDGNVNQVLDLRGSIAAGQQIDHVVRYSKSRSGVPRISVTPTGILSFANVSVGGAATERFTVTNTGSGTLTGSASARAPFSIVSGGSYSLPAGASQAVTVRFSPASVATFTGNVSFTGGAGATRGVRGSGVSGFALAVTKDGAGAVTSTPSGISCGTDCEGRFGRGTAVTLRATAARGSRFSAWGGACSAAGSSLTCRVSMTQDRAVRATFVSQTQRLTVTPSGGGAGTVTSTPSGINCGTVCAASFSTGARVALRAVPANGNRFTGWTGACTGTSPTCTVTMSGSKSVTAGFARSPRQVRFYNGLCFSPNCQHFIATFTTGEGYSWTSSTGVVSPYQAVTHAQLSDLRVTWPGRSVSFNGSFTLTAGRKYRVELDLSGSTLVLTLFDEGASSAPDAPPGAHSDTATTRMLSDDGAVSDGRLQRAPPAR
jgi:uncharacterized repeat protein (TIGR02543 family)